MTPYFSKIAENRQKRGLVPDFTFSIIDPAWEAIKEERLIIENKDIANIYPYDEKKKYEYESYCHIRNDVRTFYGIVNR